MDDRHRDILGALLERVLDLSPEARGPFMEEACAEDPALRAELEDLIVASESSARLFDRLGSVAARALGAAARQHGDHLRAGDLVLHYRIEERIGGGMGVVYKATDVRLGRAVALKFLPPWLASDPDSRERLHAEARAASSLNHPNIAAVHDIGETERDGLFIALAWCEGESLRERLRRGALPLDEIINVARQLAGALAAAHAAGIIHRDVKPSNIMVDATGIVRLLDFGIAKIAGRDLTIDGHTLGTVAYMSPEQTRSASVDARADLWSLGVVMYEMLTGRRPFDGDSDAIVVNAIRHDAPVPVRELRWDAPPGLIRIVERCMAKAPAERPAGAADLLRELDALRGAAGQRRLLGTPLARRVAVFSLAASTIVAAAWLLGSDGRIPGIGARAASGIGEPRAVAVLPFESRSGSAEHRYFADALHDEIRSRLAAVRSLRVSSRTSVMQYRDAPKGVRAIGAELGVDAVLEGTVMHDGDQVRVIVELIDTRTDVRFWSATYDRQIGLAGLFTTQREIAYSVADALRAELTEAERARVARLPTENLEAYRHYRLGRHYWNLRGEAGMDSAARHFREALRHDPLYAAAHSGLADVHVLGYGPAGTDGPRMALHEARAALAIDPQLAEAYASLGMALFYHELDFSAAERAFRRSIELEPSYATAHHWFAELLAVQGRLDESIREVRIAESLDPLSTIIGWNVARILDFARRREESIAKLAAVERLHPDDAQVQASMIGALLTLGRNDEAAARFDRLILSLPDEMRTANEETLRRFREGIATGDPAAMLSFLELVVPSQSHQRVFAAHRIAIAGHVDSAMRLVQALHEERSFGQMLPDVAVGSLFDPFRDEPRFQSILRELRIDPAIGRRLRDSDPSWRPLQRP